MPICLMIRCGKRPSAPVPSSRAKHRPKSCRSIDKGSDRISPQVTASKKSLDKPFSANDARLFLLYLNLQHQITANGAKMYKPRQPLNPEFLDKYERESTWALAQGITYRTSKRYRDQGMPFLMWAGCVFVPKAEA